MNNEERIKLINSLLFSVQDRANSVSEAAKYAVIDEDEEVDERMLNMIKSDILEEMSYLNDELDALLFEL